MHRISAETSPIYAAALITCVRFKRALEGFKKPRQSCVVIPVALLASISALRSPKRAAMYCRQGLNLFSVSLVACSSHDGLPFRSLMKSFVYLASDVFGSLLKSQNTRSYKLIIFGLPSVSSA